MAFIIYRYYENVRKYLFAKLFFFRLHGLVKTFAAPTSIENWNDVTAFTCRLSPIKHNIILYALCRRWWWRWLVCTRQMYNVFLAIGTSHGLTLCVYANRVPSISIADISNVLFTGDLSFSRQFIDYTAAYNALYSRIYLPIHRTRTHHNILYAMDPYRNPLIYFFLEIRRT